MTAGGETRSQILLARIALALLLVLALLGLYWYGFSVEVHRRIWQDIEARPGGPMTFRFLLQPAMAAIAALADGVKDARAGRKPYFWALITDPETIGSRLREGFIDIARILLLGMGMDAVYQFIVLETFYPGEMVLVAILLAFVPYLLLRGPFTRIARWWFRHESSGPHS